MTSAAIDLELIRASALLDTDPGAAAERAGAILSAAPAHEPAQLLLASACRRLGDSGRAIALLESLSRGQPDAPALQTELGRAYAAAGRDGDAIAAFRRAVALDANRADDWRELAARLFAIGDSTGGDLAYANYERRAVDPPGLQDAVAALADERVDAADALLKARLARTPDDVLALRLLADVATRRENHEEAQRLLETCLRYAPGYARARYDLAEVFYAQQRPEKVLPLIERLLAIEPRHSLCLNLKARTLRLVGRYAEAIEVLEGLLRERPGDDSAWVLLGHVFRELGRGKDAIDAYRRAIDARVDSSEAYFSLANLKTVPLTDADVTAMRALLARTTLLSEDRVRLQFALGKALEDRAEYAESFEHYAKGNALHRKTLRYDPAVATGLVRRSKALYSAQFFRDRSGWGSDRADPIFILGLPRSGSTLIEQILATHSQVEGTRELSDLSIVCIELVAGAGPDARRMYPDCVAGFERGAIDAAAAAYLERTSAHRALARPRFIDKMPANFSHVGLIQLMFPNCSIIDARRHPMGTGFSCWRQLFAWGAPFSYEQGELGRYLRDYHELMADFDRQLPGRAHRVHYERLIADPEAEVRSLLAYCGLPFEAECLKFYDNRRVVQTISSEQVRMPLYSGAVAQWRHYEPWLGPLQDALGDLIERYPAAGAGAP